jgi:CMP-N,N'-diacetyllegionaminic acid synthase
MLLAFIPARGGSKGIPRKNLALLAGKPLIQYTLEAALASREIDDILLSTDDEEIAAFCAHAGVTTRYRRPAPLAGDDAPMLAALEHALEWYARERGSLPQEVLVLQPTSPLRTAADIDGAVARFRQSPADTLASVHRLAEHPSECLAVEEGGGWRYLVPPPPSAARRQDYRGDYFFINGAVYLARTAALLRERRFVVPGATLLYEMPRAHGIDVDSLLDLAYAEAVLGRRAAGGEGGG